MKPKVEGPAAYVLTASDPRLGPQAELLRVLQKQGVEISRATSAFTVTLPARPAASGGGGGRGGRGGGQRGGDAPPPAATTPQAGSPQATASQAAPPPAPAETLAPMTREFPAGSYIVRMDQPYSRTADALLDYQYWAPNDPQTRPYDDTGWTFPEGFGVQAVRVTDVKVLDAPVELVKGEVKAVGGVSGQGSLFAIKETGNNSLITLRYTLKDADIQVAEEPFEAGGAKFTRGTFIVKGVARGDLDKQLTSLGLEGVALAAAPTVKTHVARAARVAILHQWTSTQTEGWWRQAFDIYGVPYDYIDPETVKKTPNLRAKYDVIIFGPGGGQGAVEGSPMWRNPTPWKKSELPNIGTWAQTDDTRIGMGLEGVTHLREFIAQGGVFVGSNSSAELGRPMYEGTNLTPLPTPVVTQPWQYPLPTDEQLKRNPANLIPPQFRPRVALRFDAQNTLLVSGLLDGGTDIAQRPVVVDVPVGQGHVVLFANNPIYRGETIGSYSMVFNTLLNFDSLNAGRKQDAK